MNQLTLTNTALPASLQEAFAAEKEKSEAITSGVGGFVSLPRLSIKGKEFSVSSGNQVQQLPPYIDVIIADARPNVSKLYYSKVFDPNSKAGQPDCASVNGVTPDFVPSIVDKETGKCPNNCKNCYFNQFGTALQGKGKACKDYKRLIIMFAGTEQAPFNPSLPAVILDLPATSFRAPAGSNVTMFNEFVSQCERNNLPVSGVVVRLSMMPGVAFSKIVMQAVRVVTEQEYARVLELRESNEVKSALTDKYEPRTDDEDEEVPPAEIKKETDWVPPASEMTPIPQFQPIQEPQEEKKPVKRTRKVKEDTQEAPMDGTVPLYQNDALSSAEEDQPSADELAALKELEAVLGE